MTPISLFSFFASMSYVFSYVIFFKGAKGKFSLELLLYVHLSNALTSLGSAPGNPLDYSLSCWWMGIATNVFTISNCLWTMCVAFVINQMFYQEVGTGSKIRIGWKHHLLCWGLPILVTVIPFGSASYGAPGRTYIENATDSTIYSSNNDGLGWCWIVDNFDSPAWGAGMHPIV